MEFEDKIIAWLAVFGLVLTLIGVYVVFRIMQRSKLEEKNLNH